MPNIRRYGEEIKLTIANGESVSDIAYVADLAGFMVLPVGTVEGTHLQFLEDYKGAGVDVYDNVATLLTCPFTTAKWVVVPADCFSFHRMRIKTCSAVDGTAQAQTGEATLILRCKG